MRRNRKSNMKKERVIMLASSAFVLAALTMTGLYMKNSNTEAQDDGYTLDFTAMEDNAENKFEEIAQNAQEDNTNQLADNRVQNQTGNTTFGNTDTGIQEEVTDDDLDYMPLEVGSGTIEIPGLTDNNSAIAEGEENLADVALEDDTLKGDVLAETDLQENELTEVAKEKEDAENLAADKAASTEKVVVEQALSFTEADGLLRPLSGEVLLPYSMDSSIYFATLDQYKCNSAVVFSAAEGTDVLACADGKVVDIFTDAEIGNAVTLDLGNGYQATYGQLNEINVALDSYVDAGDKLGVVAAPTIYYSVEGSNLYFKLTKDGVAVDPEGMFQ